MATNQKTVKVRFSAVIDVEVPADWTADQVDFWLNESCHCISNDMRPLFDALKAHLKANSGCACGFLKARVISAGGRVKARDDDDD